MGDADKDPAKSMENLYAVQKFLTKRHPSLQQDMMQTTSFTRFGLFSSLA